MKTNYHNTCRRRARSKIRQHDWLDSDQRIADMWVADGIEYIEAKMKVYAETAVERSKTQKSFSGFWNWVLWSPQAFNIAVRCGILAPLLLFPFLLVLSISINMTVGIWINGFLCLLAVYNVIRNRQLFKVDMDRNIAGFVYKIEVKRK